MESSSNNMDLPTNGQNVQRLGTNSTSELVPLVLRDLTKYDEKITKLRSLLIERNLTKGNNKYMKFYKKRLPKTLSPGAFNWGVGLLLSDATAQINLSESKPTCRLKMQAAERHKEYLDITQEILKPWVMTISESSKNRKMINLATIQHEAFLPYVDLFQYHL